MPVGALGPVRHGFRDIAGLAPSLGGLAAATGRATTRRAPPVGAAFGPHGPAHGRDQLLDDGQPEAGAVLAARRSVGGDVEPLEDVGEVLVGDARTVVVDGQLGLVSGAAVVAMPTLTVTVVRANFWAFSRRLAITCPRRSGSAETVTRSGGTVTA